MVGKATSGTRSEAAVSDQQQKDSDSERRGVRQSVVRLIVFDLAGQHFIALALASSLRTSVETAGVLAELPEGRLLAFGTDNSQVT